MVKNIDREEVYIDPSIGTEEAKEAFGWLGNLAKTKGKQKALIAIPSKKFLDGAIRNVIGKDVVRTLKEREPVSYGKVKIRIITNRIDEFQWNGGPIIILFPNQNLLDKIDGMKNTSHVIVVPQTLGGIQFWVNQWSVSELKGRNKDGTGVGISEPVVEEALNSLDSLVNVSTGLTNSFDRARAIETFKVLLDNGYDYSPDEIRAWLIVEKGWEPKYAEDVREVSDDVKAGKNLQYEGGSWKENIIEQWEEQADA